jgi:hypothetical protein
MMAAQNFYSFKGDLLMSNGYEFGDDVEYVESAPEEGRVQWFHHKKSCDPTGKKILGDIYGWCIQANRWDYLDKACAEAGLKQFHVKQGQNINCYWQLGSSSDNQNEWGSARFFILAKGMLSVEQMGLNGGKHGFNGVRAGIAAGWGKRKGDDKAQKSLKFRAFPEELLVNGYLERPVVVSVSGKSKVDDLLTALGKDGHARVIRANNARLEARGARPITPYAGFSLALMVGDQSEIQQQDGDQGSAVTKIITDIPAQIDDAFLDSHHAGDWWSIIWEDIKANDYSIEWSKEASKTIYAGDEEVDAIHDAPPMAEESYDHPFDDDGLEDDAEFAARAREASKPTAKPVPSNSLKPLPDSELKKIQGTANEAQRRALQKLGNLLLAQKAGLTREQAAAGIKEAQRLH